MNLVKPLVFTILLLATIMVQVSCTQAPRPATIIIAVDKISPLDFSCGTDVEEKPKSGIKLLCEESVRFTHAYTTSSMTIPALSSILTGLYPFQHSVHNNGSNPLKAEIITLPELLISKGGIRTSFFSGGAPVWRKSGLNQGFEIFDDNITPSIKTPIRSFRSTADLFRLWLSNELKSPFFSIIYVPDLNLTNIPTTNDLGEPRNLTYASQLEEVDEVLFNLFTYLKTTKLWNNLTIILVGLQGHSEDLRPNELDPLNLQWENTQIPLLIKPSRKLGDIPSKWKIDRNISLADLGVTLFDYWGLKVSTPKKTHFPTLSLKPLIEGINPGTPTDRPIPLESGWAQWHFIGELRTGEVKGNYLFLNNKYPILFNTLIDHLEANPIPLSLQSSANNEFKEDMTKLNAKPWMGLSKKTIAKYSIPFMTWMQEESKLQLLNELKNLEKNNKEDLELKKWLAKISVETKDWPTLIRMGTLLLQPAMIYVGEKNLHKKIVETNDPCLTTLNLKLLDSEKIKKCDDPLFLDLLFWIKSSAFGLKRETQRAKFIRNYKYWILDQKILRLNIALKGIWDTSTEKPLTPNLSELTLNLPEYQKFLGQVQLDFSELRSDF